MNFFFKDGPAIFHSRVFQPTALLMQKTWLLFSHCEGVTQAKTVFQFENVWDLLAPSGGKSLSAEQMNSCSLVNTVF